MGVSVITLTTKRNAYTNQKVKHLKKYNKASQHYDLVGLSQTVDQQSDINTVIIR